MMKSFPCGLCSDEVGDNDDSFSVTYATSGITLDILILTLNNTKSLKKIHCPGTVQTVQWKYLSQLYLINV